MRRLDCRQGTNSDVWILFEFTTWLVSFPDFFTFLRHYSVIGKQLLFANNRNRIRWAVFGLPQDEDWIDSFEKFSLNTLKGDLSNAITFNPPLFSLVNTFKLFSRKFSRESVQAPSCERHKTTQRTLFLFFSNNYWFPITLLCLAAADFSHHTLNWNNGIVLLPCYLKWREKSGLHNKSFQITLTIHATFGVSAKDQ